MEKELSKTELLKLDRLGRVRVSAERREALLDEFERCGVSGAQFAKSIGVNYQTFSAWRQKRAREGLAVSGGSSSVVTKKPSGALRWVEAVVERDGVVGHGAEQAAAMGGQSVGAIWVELPGGGRVEMRAASEAKLVAALLRAVAQKEALAC